MSNTPSPLFIDIGDRRCYCLYLLSAHLIVLAVVLFSSISPVMQFSMLIVIGVSAHYWFQRERADDHPRILKWNDALGWRLGLSKEDLPVVSIRHLQTPFCILLEIESERGVELLFLRNRPELNRLRYLLKKT